MMVSQPGRGCSRQPPLDARFHTGLPKESPGDPLDLPPPLPERRHFVTGRQPGNQVLSEFPLADRRTQVPVRRGDDTDIGLANGGGSHDTELPRLEESQEHRLHRGRKRSELVEEERAARRSFDQTGPGVRRAGIGSPHIPEQLRLRQRLREDAAVLRYERTRGPGTQIMENPGEMAFPGSRLP